MLALFFTRDTVAFIVAVWTLTLVIAIVALSTRALWRALSRP